MPHIIFNLYFDLWAQVDCSKKRFDWFLNDTPNKTKRNFLCISLSDVKRSIEVMVKSVNPVATREKENSKGQDALHWRNHQVTILTRSSWFNCALRGDEADNWCYWVSRGHLCLYILNRVEIWTGVTDPWLTQSQTLKDRATQLLVKYKSGALVTQLGSIESQEWIT